MGVDIIIAQRIRTFHTPCCYTIWVLDNRWDLPLQRHIYPRMGHSELKKKKQKTFRMASSSRLAGSLTDYNPHNR